MQTLAKHQPCPGRHAESWQRGEGVRWKRLALGRYRRSTGGPWVGPIGGPLQGALDFMNRRTLVLLPRTTLKKHQPEDFVTIRGPARSRDMRTFWAQKLKLELAPLPESALLCAFLSGALMLHNFMEQHLHRTQCQSRHFRSFSLNRKTNCRKA